METATKLWVVFCLIFFVQDEQLAQSSLSLSKLLNRTNEVKIPSLRYSYLNTQLQQGEQVAVTNFDFQVNAFGIGWTSDIHNISPSTFHINYRFKDSNGWTNWSHAHGEIGPSESPSNKYWSSLIISDNMSGIKEMEIKITPSDRGVIKTLTIDASYIDKSIFNSGINSGARSSGCPTQPFIFSRSDWWGTLPSDELYYPNATNSKTPSYNTSTTHAFVHHGASSNNYTDGASVVRAYWNFHVNSRGWKDIGYTYLVDKFGNLYMGRYNPDWPNRDVLGAHTGVCNPYSFAICAIGDYTSVPLNVNMLNSINHLMAYKCNLRRMNPIGTGFIYSASIDIISGHRLAPGATTTCPGDSAFNMINQIRLGTKQILDSCASIPVLDSISPITTISSPNLWEITDFSVSFSDIDDSAGSGIKDKLVNVSYYQNLWKANVSNGYFNDQFDQISSSWTSSVGNWMITNNKLKQDDENESNTNIYAALNQDTSSKYLYHWKGLISGSGTNKRAGLHFMCSTPSQTQRGDSYLIYFREDDNKIQIYKSVGNVLYLKEDTVYSFNANVKYDFKVIFTKSSGAIDVYINNQLGATYTDPWPFTSGSYVSFRTGNCIYEVDLFEVYRERMDSILVSVGPGVKDIAAQNETPIQAAGIIKSIAVDSLKNMSPTEEKYINVDWTGPQVQYVNDGFIQGLDVDTIIDDNKIESNWQVKDDQSGVRKYYFGVGNIPGLTNIVPYTDIGVVTRYAMNAGLIHGDTYYVSIRAINGAGLDTIVISDGQYLKDFITSIEIRKINKIVSDILLYPNPSNRIINLSFTSEKSESGRLVLIDTKGSEVYNSSLQIKEGKNKFQISPKLTKGYYFVKLIVADFRVLIGIQAIE